MANILVVNDDGPETPFFEPFLHALKQTGHDIYPIIPAEQQSWRSKCISRTNPVTIKQKLFAGILTWLVTGTPADCTNIGVYHWLNENVDLIVSGPNLGHNLGRGSILSSGTIGAALEGAILGYPSIAISYPYFTTWKNKDFSTNHKIAISLILKILEKGLPKNVDFLNVNIPEGVNENAPIRYTMPWNDNYRSLFTKQDDGTYIHTGGLRPTTAIGYPQNTDIHAIMNHEISIIGFQASYTTIPINDW